MFTFLSKSEVLNPEDRDVSFVKIHRRIVEFKIKQDVTEVQACCFHLRNFPQYNIWFRADIHVMQDAFQSLPCSVPKT